MQFSQRLKELRTEKGVSQAELAEKIYVSRSAVAKWENGLGLPCDQSLELIAEYFGVSRDSLLSDMSSETIIVDKNIAIVKSKKINIAIGIVCFVALAAIVFLLVYFTCYAKSDNGDYRDGDSVAQIVGIYGKIWDGNDRNISYADSDTSYANAYKLKQNIEYRLDVNFLLSGGSTPAMLLASGVAFEYDSALFDITLLDPDRDSYSQSACFIITVKAKCELAEIVIKTQIKDAWGKAMSTAVFISAE